MKKAARFAFLALTPALFLACGTGSEGGGGGASGGAGGTQGTAGAQGAAGGQGAGGTTGIGGTQGGGGTQGSGGTQGAAGTQGGAGTGGTAGAQGSAGIGGGAGTTGGAGGAGGGGAGTGGNAGAPGGRGGATAGSGGRGGGAGTGGQAGAAGRGGSGGSAAGAGGRGGSGGAGGSGGGAGGGSAGTGGSGAYNPCPTNGNACVILPLGDSITHGYASTDDAGYRSPLFKLIVAASQKVTFTGSLTNGPTQVSGQTFPRSHEGHDGWTIDPGYSTYNASGISTLIPSPAFNGKPNIILLHIGTNDTGFMDSANMSTRLEALLDKIAQNSPTSLIVLAQIAPLGYANSALTTYNSRIPGIVQSHAAKGQHIVGVDMSKMPLSDIGSDNVHPNDTGYGYMANIWYAAIKDLLPN